MAKAKPRGARRAHTLQIRVTFNKEVTTKEAAFAVNNCVHGEFFDDIRRGDDTVDGSFTVKGVTRLKTST